MTAAEKAKELVEKFIMYTPEDPKYEVPFAKQCALIAVDEVQQTETLEDRHCGYLPIEKNHKEYWQQVKVEIENL